MIKITRFRMVPLALVMAVVALLTFSSCSQSSSGGSDSSSGSGSAATSPTVLNGTWKYTWGGIDYTYVFTDTTYEVTTTYNGESKLAEKGTYSITDLVFTTNQTYPATKTTDWTYTLETVDGKQVFTYNLYNEMTKQ